MAMTREQRNAPRHQMPSVLQNATSCAARFNTSALIYRSRNGFLMYGREIAYEPRKGNRPLIRVLLNGTTENLD